MEYLKLDKKAITSWRIGRSIALLIFAIVSVAWFVICKAGTMPIGAVISGCSFCAIIILLLIVNLAVYPPIEYRQWKYLITEDRIEIIHGIFFVKTTVIPIIRVQNITMSQGPINRKLGLCKVEISIASDSFEIPCLSKVVADEIVTNLKDKIYIRLAAKEMK